MSFFERFFSKKETVSEGPVPPEILPQRNDICWCGSGLKYKKCHLEQDRIYLAQKREKEVAAKKACSPVFG